MPPTQLVILPVPGNFTAGLDSGPVTVEARNASNQPATLTSALTVSLTSNTSGEYSFTLSPGGARVTTVNILPSGPPQGVFYYRDYKAGGWTLTASEPSLAPGNGPVSVAPAAYAALQVLLPGETSDPGRPLGNPSGKTGSPASTGAG